ncbi:lysylphosphatidylglycerol synthase transmembrane domain-containing protein [Tengunoibacter tsumagoiensis]|uniref:Flippase-like domain-containing protein n=1 Tax=Tengunoibacter tsumagoiensis TaxID=2014871 RepID=A0A401ZVS8_9CHLR|nr:lysylphosphatidylglycerol synthase transmembrane domain-containing protein [Tengunoibacter tsumagoiensis]GCE10906.1 hypothetical protein KTT_07650 [Tengunoibacter tsumagoiensis]
MTIQNPELIAPRQEHQLAEVVTYKLPAVVPKKKKNKTLGLLLRLGVTVLLFAFLFKSLSFSTLITAITHLQSSIALAGLVIGVYTLVVSAYQWQCLLTAERIPMDLTKLINLYMVGIAFSHFLPSSMGGDVIKVYYVGREANNTPGSASAAVMARITGFFGMLVVAYPALLLWHTHFSQQVVFLLLGLSVTVLSMVIGTFIFALLFARFAQAKWVQSRFSTLLPRVVREKLVKSGIFGKAMDIGTTLLVSARKPQPMLKATLFGVLFHIVACLNYFTYGLALHMEVPFYFYLVAIPLVSLIAFLPVSVNGFGLRESALVFIFSTVHVPAATTLLLAFVMDVQQLFFGALGGWVYLLMGSQKKLVQNVTS